MLLQFHPQDMYVLFTYANALFTYAIFRWIGFIRITIFIRMTGFIHINRFHLYNTASAPPCASSTRAAISATVYDASPGTAIIRLPLQVPLRTCHDKRS